DFEIPLYDEGTSDEAISGLKAVTYNLENGKIVETKMKNDGFFKEKFSDNLYLVKVALPNVKVGSVVEITYKINSDFLMNFWDWEFQETIPVVWSEYRAAIPEFFNYDKYMQGYIPLNISDEDVVRTSINITTKERTGGEGWSGTQTNFSNDKIDFNEKRFRWVAKDVPSFKAEPFITTYKDYISKLNFELAYIKYPNQPIEPVLGSWDEINKKYFESENFGRVVTSNGFLKKTVDEITAGKSSDEQKISAVLNYVKDNVTWDGTSRRSVDGSLKKVIDEKKGTSAEINFLVASMLEKANITVHPVLISTRDHGFVRENIPVTSQFNYVICVAEINGKQILLDATDKLLPVGIIPERCLNGNGLVISKQGYRWAKLVTPLKTKSFLTAELTLDADAILKGKISFDRVGYSAHRSRKSFLSKAENDYIKDVIGTHSWEISKSEFLNAKNIDQTFKETHEVTINDHVTTAGDVIYLNPFIEMQEVENPFKSEKREYPVDFGSPHERMYMTKIIIPKGYRLDELPKPQIFMLPENAAKFVYNIVITGDVINVTSHLQINKSLFIQDEYPHLREFYTRVVSKQAEQIVLKKN
ncbi:MAG TPA: transglutaminase domain-containing protein, partial [Chryseolinea sp.]